MIRECVVCGKKLHIKLDKNNKISGGYYFGKMKLPIGKGEYKKVGISKFKIAGKKVNVVKWTGKHKTIEYWECKKCFNEDQI